MKPKDTDKQIANMDVLHRLSSAQEKTRWMVDELLDLMALHENNAIITYSPLLSNQIPRSYAARAFNVVQKSIHRYEIIRLCTFWDGVDLEKANIPTVIELIDDPRIFNHISQDLEDHWRSMRHEVANPNPDPGVQIKIESLLYESNQSFGRQEGAKAVQRLEQTIKAARETIASHKLSSVQNIRNKLAHRLKETRAEKGPTTVHPAKYGDEKDLLVH
jgi:hypothetical protein